MRKQFVLFLLFFFVRTPAFAQADWQRTVLLQDVGTTCLLSDIVSFEDTLIVMSYDGYLFRSNNFFTSYEIDSNNKGSQFDAMSFGSRNVGYISSTQVQGGLLKTVDGGVTWSALTIGPSSGVSIGNTLLFVDEINGLGAHSFNSVVNIVKDGGANGVSIPAIHNQCQKVFRVCSPSDSVYYIIANDWATPGPSYLGFTNLFKSINLGTTWQKVSSVSSVRGICDMHFLDDTTVIIASRQLILKSIDAGLTFDTVMQSSNALDGFSTPVNALSFSSRDTGFVAYSGGSVYRTFDAGATWARTSFAFDVLDASNEIFSVSALSSTKVIIGCGNGVIYKTETGGGVWSDVDEIKGKEQFLIYPNPATTQLTLTIPPPTQPTTATITDVNGRLLCKEQLLNATNTLNIAELPAGLYFIAVQSAEQRWVRRFVKQ